MSTELENRLREDIGPEDFGVPAEFAQGAKNYARWLESDAVVWKREADQMRKGRDMWRDTWLKGMAAAFIAGVVLGFAIAQGVL